MDEGEKLKKARPKEKVESSNDIYNNEASASPLDVVNVTSLADIFDTAFTSTADPTLHPRYPSGNKIHIFFLINNSTIFINFTLKCLKINLKL